MMRVLAVILALIFLLYYVTWDGWYQALFTDPWFFDDGFMFLRYAKIWLMGYGESWNIGEGPVYGNTSQLHFLVVLALAATQFFSDYQIVNIGSFTPFFIFMWWMPWFCARHAPFWQEKPWYYRFVFWTLALGPFFYWKTPYTYFAYTGMDTGLSILLNLLLIDAALTYSKTGKRCYFYALIATTFLAYAARPENILPGGLFGFFWLALMDKKIRDAFVFAVAVGVLVVADLGWKYFYFGDFFPLAAYSKNSGYLEGFAGAVKNHAILTFFAFLVYLFPYVFLHCLCFRREHLKPVLILLLPVAITVCYFFTMVTLMNMGARYEFPFIPYIMASAIIFFTGFKPWLDHWKRSAIGIIVFVAIVTGVRYGDEKSFELSRYFTKDVVPCEDYILDPPVSYPNVERPGGAKGIDLISGVMKQAPAGVKVVMTEHGMVGARAPQVHIIDVIGLHNRHVAHHGFSAEWLFAQEPDMFWGPHFHYTCINRKIFYAEKFWQHYRFFPGLFSWGISLRVDGPHYQELYRLVDDSIRKQYPGYTLDDFEKKRHDKVYGD